MKTITKRYYITLANGRRYYVDVVCYVEEDL